MKKILMLGLVMVLAIAVQNANAQSTGSNYKWAIGGKGYFGDWWSLGGVNVKVNLNNKNAVEASALFRSHVFVLEGIYQWQNDIRGARGLKWYTGPGAQLGFYDSKWVNDDRLFFALKGTVGLDYKFSGAPINLALDVNPVMVLAPDTDFDVNMGLAFRFAF